MATPTFKDPVMNLILNMHTGSDRVYCIEHDKCVSCGGDAVEFNDQRSEREFTISGLCQKCQDGVFGAMEEE